MPVLFLATPQGPHDSLGVRCLARPMPSASLHVESAVTLSAAFILVWVGGQPGVTAGSLFVQPGAPSLRQNRNQTRRAPTSFITRKGRNLPAVGEHPI